MLAKTSSCVDSLDIQNIKETAQKLRDKFCERHPEIQGKRRDQVKDIFYYAIKFNHKNMPTDTHTQCVFHIIRLRLIIFHTPKKFNGRNKIE